MWIEIDPDWLTIASPQKENSHMTEAVISPG